MKLYPNGILVQGLTLPTNYLSSINYHGILAYHDFPLQFIRNEKCKAISNKVPNFLFDDGTSVQLQFISNMDLAVEYNAICPENAIDIRNLFIESCYPDELWNGVIPKTTFLGFEYCTIPFDCQIVTDMEWYEPFHLFRSKLNANGLFDSYEDAVEFKRAYDDAVKKNEVGDDNPPCFIFKISELSEPII